MTRHSFLSAAYYPWAALNRAQRWQALKQWAGEPQGYLYAVSDRTGAVIGRRRA